MMLNRQRTQVIERDRTRIKSPPSSRWCVTGVGVQWHIKHLSEIWKTIIEFLTNTEWVRTELNFTLFTSWNELRQYNKRAPVECVPPSRLSTSLHVWKYISTAKTNVFPPVCFVLEGPRHIKLCLNISCSFCRVSSSTSYRWTGGFTVVGSSWHFHPVRLLVGVGPSAGPGWRNDIRSGGCCTSSLYVHSPSLIHVLTHSVSVVHLKSRRRVAVSTAGCQ